MIKINQILTGNNSPQPEPSTGSGNGFWGALNIFCQL
jgi:hypothetical protein